MAIAIGLFCGFIDLALPAEDALRALRAQLRTSEVSGEVVLIAVDDSSYQEFGFKDPSRSDDARLIDKVFDLGLERLAFDRAFAMPTTKADDEALARALERHRGRVWIGASSSIDNGIVQYDGLLPAPIIRQSAQLAVMEGYFMPFDLSVLLPTSGLIEGRKAKSISANLAQYQGPDMLYRPDFAFDIRAIPKVSYSDILNGRVEEGALRGKSAIVTFTYLGAKDFHYLPFGSKIPGAYFHILGAETLKRGMPIDLGYYPALLLAALLLALQASRKRPEGRFTWLAVATLAIAPLLLETVAINVDIVAALLAILIGTWRLNHLASQVYSRSTDLMMPQAIAASEGGGEIDVYALKINNLGDFSDSTAPRELGLFIERILACIRTQSEVCPKEGLTAFDKDTVVWTHARTDRDELRDNALAISTLLANASGTGHFEGKLEVSIAIDVNHGLKLERRIQNASQAAEIASRRGHRVLIADQSFLDDRERRIALLAALDRALESGAIALAYQPKVDLLSRQTVGAEALVRWTHEALGVVNPQELIAVAEEHDRIDALTEHVIDRALAEMKPALLIDERFRLAVNISAQSLTQESLVHIIRRLCDKHAFPACNLVLEITETQKLEDERVHPIIMQLHEMGIGLSIDDFGTGHSSLDYLQRFPSCELKIDRKFVMNLRTSHDSRTLIRATIELAHSMNKIVVAEGVDNELTATELKRMQCDLAQGFLFAAALPARDFIPFIKRRSAAA